MNDLTTVLRREQRRHFAISSGLLALAVVAGTMVTNERGVFSAIGTGPMSAFGRAFLALADTPRTPPLFGRNSGYGPAGPLRNRPFGAPRRLLNDAAPAPDQVVGADQLPPIVSQPITPIELAANSINDGVVGPPGGFGSSGGGSGPVTVPDGTTTTPTGTDDTTPPVDAVPEPAAWALLIGGFGAIGAVQRRQAAARRRRLLLNGD